MNKKGQSILSEYTMIFFVVIAVAVAMATFLQRAFQSRIHEARNFMISSVANSSVCDSNCAKATGNILYEYEPYYAQTFSDVQHNKAEVSQATKGNPNVIGVLYTQAPNEKTTVNSLSCQLPPECDSPQPPSYCTSFVCVPP